MPVPFTMLKGRKSSTAMHACVKKGRKKKTKTKNLSFPYLKEKYFFSLPFPPPSPFLTSSFRVPVTFCFFTASLVWIAPGNQEKQTIFAFCAQKKKKNREAVKKEPLSAGFFFFWQLLWCRLLRETKQRIDFKAAEKALTFELWCCSGLSVVSCNCGGRKSAKSLKWFPFQKYGVRNKWVQTRLPYSLRRSLIPSRTFCKPRILFRVPIPGKREVHPEFRKILEIEIREVKKCRKKKLQACLRPGLLHFYRPDCSLIVLFGVWVGLGLGSDFFPKIQDGAVKCGRKVSGGLEKVISSKKSGFWVLQGGFCWHFALRINRRSPY